MEGEEDPPPPYPVAITKDPLPLLAPYIPKRDLFSACLVCKSWHGVFSEYIWQRPDVFWGLGDRSALTHFTKYLNVLLHSTRERATRHLSTRAVVPTLYTAFPKHWLETLLQRLPRLESLDLSSWPLVDHAAATAVSHSTALRRFTARECANVTVGGLVNLLAHMPCLEEVDFSGTKIAGTPAVITAMARLPLRRVLLRNVGVTDVGLEILAQGLGTGLREVDVSCHGTRGGRVGGKGIEALLGYCFAPPEYDITATATASSVVGLTKLGISGNKVPPRSVQMLLRTTRLTSLDVGALDCVDGVMTAVKIYAWAKLEYLRIDWRVVLDPAFVGVGKIVLVDVPAFASSRAARGIASVVGVEGVKVLELEMEVADGSGDFSFFEEEAGGGGKAGEEKGDVDVLSCVAARKRGIGWRGRVRVVRDLAGGESTERGVGGELWGVVREGV